MQHSQAASAHDRAELGHVAQRYVHRRKHATPGPALQLPAACLKWYEIAAADTPVPAAIGTLARRCIEREVASGALDFDGDLGFVLLHRCGANFYFLLPCTWRNDNELWETVYAKRADDADFAPFTFEGPHRGTFCVWELGVIWHEVQAWDRYLLSLRGAHARHAYLGDHYTGPV